MSGPACPAKSGSEGGQEAILGRDGVEGATSAGSLHLGEPWVFMPSEEEDGAQDGRREAPGSEASSPESPASRAKAAEKCTFGLGLPSSVSSEEGGKIVKSGEVGVRASGGRVCVVCVGAVGASRPLGSFSPRCPSGGLGRVMVGAQQPNRGQEMRSLSVSRSEEEKEVGICPVVSRAGGIGGGGSSRGHLVLGSAGSFPVCPFPPRLPLCLPRAAWAHGTRM